MKKKVAKVFKKFGKGKIKIIKDYQPRSKAPKTTAITGNLFYINRAIGNCMLDGTKEERLLMGTLLSETFYEDREPDTKELIKF